MARPPFSIAVGIAELFPGGDATSALEEADRRMYAEKRARCERCRTVSAHSLSKRSRRGLPMRSRAKGSIFGIPRRPWLHPAAGRRIRIRGYRSVPRERLWASPPGPTPSSPRTSSPPGCAAPASSSSRRCRPSMNSRSPSPASTCRMRATTWNGRRSSRVEESFHEYLHAWVLIHALHRAPRFSRRAARG